MSHCLPTVGSTASRACSTHISHPRPSPLISARREGRSLPLVRAGGICSCVLGRAVVLHPHIWSCFVCPPPANLIATHKQHTSATVARAPPPYRASIPIAEKLHNTCAKHAGSQHHLRATCLEHQRLEMATAAGKAQQAEADLIVAPLTATYYIGASGAFDCWKFMQLRPRADAAAAGGSILSLQASTETACPALSG